MSLISLMDARLSHGGELLLDSASLAVEEGERVCLVGRNGAGKSSLLKVIAGRGELDGGRLVLRQDLRIGWLEQDPPRAEEGTVYALCARAVPAVGSALAEYAGTADPARRAALADFIERHDGWHAEAAVRRTLGRTGLQGGTPLSALSGGQRRKAALAAALCARPELLLLDEPTNHLDIAAVTWLEELLGAFHGTLILVTHDRQLADSLATRIVELDRGKLYSYPGGFARYLELRAERCRIEDLACRERDRVLSREEAWMRRSVRARLARNEGRIRDLERRRAERRLRRDRQGRVILRVNEADRPGRIIFELRDIAALAGGRTLIEHFSATVMRGDRIGVVGPNGCGKTTLAAIMRGAVRPAHGYVRIGVNVAIAWFDQYREQLREERSVADNVADGRDEVRINGRTRRVSSYLGDFLFSARRARSPVSTLSGGEKNRLLLARLFARPANVLILDEPTNDLDLETLDLLEDMLSSYPGTVVAISHDRRFIDRVATETWVFGDGGRIETVVGGWSEVLACRRSAKGAGHPGAAGKKPAPRAREKKTGRSFAQEHELSGLPGRIEGVEAELAGIDASLADGGLYAGEAARVRELAARRAVLARELERLYERWGELESLAQAST